jgi:hypothetical protein
MAIHLLLLATNKVHPGLKGLITFFSDCISGLDKVQNLPPYQIPSRCRHLDILKVIMVNCADLYFTRHYRHVKAHQDDGTKYHLLSQESQLNCAMDYKAKTAILSLNAMSLPRQQRFPLEPICIFVGNNKLTANMHDHLRYWAHLKLARSTYHSLGILDSGQFDLVDWEMVYALL